MHVQCIIVWLPVSLSLSPSPPSLPPPPSPRAGAGLSLLKYFEPVDDDEVGSSGGVGLMILRAVHILSNGSDMIVTAMMTSNLCSVLVQCVNLFLELPHPAGKHVPHTTVTVMYVALHSALYMYVHVSWRARPSRCNAQQLSVLKFTLIHRIKHVRIHWY